LTCYAKGVNETAELERVRTAKTKALALLAKLAQVNGVGITRVGEHYALKVNLAEPTPQNVRIPQEIDGVPVVVELVGRITKQSP
jgi:hypothetical protein